MPKDYFESKFYIIYYPELLFTQFNIEHKTEEHYEDYGKKKGYYHNRRALYEKF
jgi:hypothetical protein